MHISQNDITIIWKIYDNFISPNWIFTAIEIKCIEIIMCEMIQGMVLPFRRFLFQRNATSFQIATSHAWGRPYFA